MTLDVRLRFAPLALACVLLATGCSGPGASTSPEPSATTKAVSPSPSPPPTQASAKPEPSPEATATSAPPPAIELSETFTALDGTLSFRYPTGWVVTPTVDDQHADGTFQKVWELKDTDGQTELRLSVTPTNYLMGGAPLITTLPQGLISGVVDGAGIPAHTVVAVSPGQSAGSNGGLIYGAAVTGTQTWLFNFPWGEHYSLGFSGWRELGPNHLVDELTADAEQFAESPEFLDEILPIIRSLAVSAPPAVEAAPAGPLVGPCEGARFIYELPMGITCDDAKSILQTVLDSGAPKGARSQVTADYECYESSYVEQSEGIADMTCWALDAYGFRHNVILEAYYR